LNRKGSILDMERVMENQATLDQCDEIMKDGREKVIETDCIKIINE